MNEQITVLIRDNELGKTHEVYFPTMQHAEYFVMNENKFMSKSLEIIYNNNGNNTKDQSK